MKADLVVSPKLEDRADCSSNIRIQNREEESKDGVAERLRPGDRVALRTPEEILATLDEHGALEGVPFMPEMLQFSGRAFTVAKRVEKICDTICPVGSRRMQGCVYLEGLRCDGTAHGGCQAECRIYWKEEWLVRLPPGASPPVPDKGSLDFLRTLVEAQIHRPDQPELFRCQVTEARRATTELANWDLRQYGREVTSGNVTLAYLLRVTLRAVPYELKRLARRSIPNNFRPFARRIRTQLHGQPSRVREQPEPLNLKPGEWVEVRSEAEIRSTLDARGYNRGLCFSAPEMFPACGKRFRVHRRVNRIIDEPTGRMLLMKHDCIMLEGMVCTGDRSVGRWLCGREIYPYWREVWLKRAPGPETGAA